MGLDKNDPNSYHFYMMEKLFNHVDITKENVNLPNGVAPDLQKECQEYEQRIQKVGKIDVQLLGMGMNGHIGFNEPGTPFTQRTHVVELDESTRKANSRFFASLDDVPKQAITMGIGTIMESKEILLIVSGESKADAVARLLDKEEVSEDFPASILRNHDNVTVVVDEAALSKTKKNIG